MASPAMQRWGVHLTFLTFTSLPLFLFGARLVLTAGGTLPQVAMVLGLVAIVAALGYAALTSVVVWKFAHTVPRVVATHATGVVMGVLALFLAS